jgi:hypothetical protein
MAAWPRAAARSMAAWRAGGTRPSRRRSSPGPPKQERAPELVAEHLYRMSSVLVVPARTMIGIAAGVYELAMVWSPALLWGGSGPWES